LSEVRIMNKKVVAVVPVRKGSQRVVSKNTRPFADTTLLDLKLEVLKHVNGIDRIIVNTDCDISVSIAKNHGVEIYEREGSYASSSVTNDVHWRHIAEVTDADVLLMAQTTSPMIKVDTYERALHEYIEGSGRYGSINSVSPEKLFLWLDGRPINYDINKTPKSQDLPDIVSLNFAITIIEREAMYAKGNVIADNPKFVALNKVESIDIDDLLDFEFAEFAYKKYGLKWLLEK
jgi:CMP-N,N'-diacetyllegionaminic acid synthase